MHLDTSSAICRPIISASEVLTGQVRLWSTFWPSPHLHHRWFMSSMYECDLKRSMCVKKTRTAKVLMPSVSQCWFWNVRHHHLYFRQRWVNVFSLLDHQLYPATDSLTHWGRMTHICVSKLTIIGSDNWYRLAGVKRLSEPMLGYYQLDRSKQTSVNSCIFQFRKLHLQLSSGNWRPFFSASMCYLYAHYAAQYPSTFQGGLYGSGQIWS